MLNQAIVPIVASAVCNRADWYGDRMFDDVQFCAGYEEGGIDTCTVRRHCLEQDFQPTVLTFHRCPLTCSYSNTPSKSFFAIRCKITQRFDLSYPRHGWIEVFYDNVLPSSGYMSQHKTAFRTTVGDEQFNVRSGVCTFVGQTLGHPVFGWREFSEICFPL